MIRTKMVVSDIRQHPGVKRDPETGVCHSRAVCLVTLEACNGEPPDPQMPAAASPRGPLELDLSDVEGSDLFAVGNAYYLEFSPAD